MTTIDATCPEEPGGDGWTCCVTLSDDRGRSEHRVRVRTADLARYAAGATSPDELVRRSFEFLLEREPRQSILHDFDLPVIGRYFPEYETTIRG